MLCPVLFIFFSFLSTYVNDGLFNGRFSLRKVKKKRGPTYIIRSNPQLLPRHFACSFVFQHIHTHRVLYTQHRTRLARRGGGSFPLTFISRYHALRDRFYELEQVFKEKKKKQTNKHITLNLLVLHSNLCINTCTMANFKNLTLTWLTSCRK